MLILCPVRTGQEYGKLLHLEGSPGLLEMIVLRLAEEGTAWHLPPAVTHKPLAALSPGHVFCC